MKSLANEKQCKDCQQVLPFSAFCKRTASADGLNKRCRTCKAAHDAKYRESQAAWREAHREESRAYFRERYAANPERSKAQSKRWLQENPDRAAQITKRYRERHPERARAVKQRFIENNPRYWTEAGMKRRARKAAVETTLTSDEWQEIVSYFGGRCAYCGMACNPITVDHIVPIVRGGAHASDNVVPACGSCNGQKHATSLLMCLHRGWIQKVRFAETGQVGSAQFTFDRPTGRIKEVLA